MSQRGSGYERKAFDLYETPAWVTAALLPHLRGVTTVWEPAAGSGMMVNALTAGGLKVKASDIASGEDFLTSTPPVALDAIVTNPPYTLAREFIERALLLMRPRGLVAMLLRTDFDHAASRRHLFSECPAFATKVVLTKRIVWFDGPRAAPSFNHAWYIWDWKRRGSPMLAYAPAPSSLDAGHRLLPAG